MKFRRFLISLSIATVLLSLPIFLVKAFKACSYRVTAFTYGHPGEPGGGQPLHEETKIDSSANYTKPIRLTLSKPGFICEHRRPK
jgi:hypothetical protein